MKWLFGGFVSFLGLIGLFLSANAKDGELYFAGMAVFVTCVLYVLLQVKLSYDRSDAKKEASDRVGSGQPG